MIAVSQDKNSFHFLEWVPSEKGPMVIKFGKVIIKPDELNGSFNQVLLKLKPQSNTNIPLYSISLDSKSVFFTETNVNDQFEDSRLLEWFNKQALGSEIGSSIETYHFPFTPDQKKYFDIHIPTNIKSELTDAARWLSSELREVGVGIFSAEAGARYWFNASQHLSYAIWRIGKPHQILIIQDGSMAAFVTFKCKDNKINVISKFGSPDISDSIIRNLESFYTSNRIQFTGIDHLYFYQISGNCPELKILSESKNSKKTALNPFDKLQNSNVKNPTQLQGVAFAETGNSFRGIDV